MGRDEAVRLRSPVHPVGRTLVPARVIEQVVLVVPFGVVPLFEGSELGDDRPPLEAVEAGMRQEVGGLAMRDEKPG